MYSILFLLCEKGGNLLEIISRMSAFLAAKQYTL